MKYLKKDVLNIKGYYIDLGRHLSEFKRNEYYKEFGYDSFEECIQENLGLDKGTVSRSINVWRRFLDEDNKTYLKEKYEKYSYSQLVEMVTMENPDIITPDMTISEIREEKRRLKKEELRKTSENNKEVETSQPEGKDTTEKEEKENFDYGKLYGLRGIPLAKYCRKYVDESNINSIVIVDSNGKKHYVEDVYYIAEDNGDAVYYADRIFNE